MAKTARRPARSSLALRWLAVGALVLVGLLYYRPFRTYLERAGRGGRASGPGDRARAQRSAALERRLRYVESEAAVAREARRIGYVKPGEQLFIVKGIPAWRAAHAHRGYDRPRWTISRSSSVNSVARRARFAASPSAARGAGRRSPSRRRSTTTASRSRPRTTSRARRSSQRSRGSRRPAASSGGRAPRRRTPSSPRASRPRTPSSGGFVPSCRPAIGGATPHRQPQVPARSRSVRACASRVRARAPDRLGGRAALAHRPLLHGRSPLTSRAWKPSRSGWREASGKRGAGVSTRPSSTTAAARRVRRGDRRSPPPRRPDLHARGARGGATTRPSTGLAPRSPTAPPSRAGRAR